ncbi:MAG: tetratricopeptide repeat protein [Chitinophagaceae bacterium]
MKKRQILLPVLFALAAGFVVLKYNRDENDKAATVYLLKERTASSAQSEEWKSVKKRFDELMRIVRTNPADLPSRISLTALYIQEARVTGNYMYYDMAAMKYVNEVLEKDSANFEALIYKSLLFLSQHHFAEGLAMAEKARETNPYNAFVYGILIDGNVEMGDYASAIKNADQMISIRPDIRSYSRISYLREIHGDYPGAIEAMTMAVKAGVPGDEATEWSRVQLGHLYEYESKLDNAAMCYEQSLQNRPLYPYAIAGQARLSVIAKDYKRAVSYYLQADSLIHDYSFKEELLDIYQLTGQKEKANEVATFLLDAMNKDAQRGVDDDNIGHYADRELATTYVKTGNFEKALEHALAEYKRRPGNIDVNETVAWVYYKKGEAKQALPYLTEALKTNSQNPTLLYHARLIYAKLGDKIKAQ